MSKSLHNRQWIKYLALLCSCSQNSKSFLYKIFHAAHPFIHSLFRIPYAFKVLEHTKKKSRFSLIFPNLNIFLFLLLHHKISWQPLIIFSSPSQTLLALRPESSQQTNPNKKKHVILHKIWTTYFITKYKIYTSPFLIRLFSSSRYRHCCIVDCI